MPASKVNSAKVDQAILSDGCIITDATIERSLIGLRTIIEAGTVVRDSVLMGADYFPHEDPRRNEFDVAVGIGKDCKINKAIIDKNARIGDGCVITPEGKPDHVDGENYYIRDGIVVVPKGACIPAGTWI